MSITSGAIKQFGIDKQAQTEGVWHKLEANSDGTIPRLKIAQQHSRNRAWFAKYLATQHHPDYEKVNEDPAAADRVAFDTGYKTLLTDWEHIQDDNGAVIPFNDEKKVKTFCLKYPELLDFVVVKSEERKNFLIKQKVTTAKKS